jgi:hypothetical protein
MLILLFFTLLIGLSLIGYGGLLIWILNLFKIFPNFSFSLSDYSLLGIFVVITLAIIANFLIPLSDFSGVVTLLLGITLLILFNYKNNNLFLIRKDFISILIMVFCGVIVFSKLENIGIISYRSYKTFYHYDTGLYQMPFLQWIASHSIPIGLANLHGRFGFDSSWLIFHSAWRSPGIGWSSLAIIEGWIWTLGIWVFGEGLVKSWLQFRIGNRILLITLALIFFINFAINEPGSVASTDHASNIFALVTVVYFLEFLNATAESSQSNIDRGILLMFVSSSLAITAKLSMFLVILLPIVGSWMVLKSLPIQRSLIASLILGIVFFSLWILRNLLLSGCLVYPVAFTCLNEVSWGVGSQQAILEKNAVTGWARSPDIKLYLQSLNNYEWLSSWFLRLLEQPTIKLVLTLLLSGLLLPIFEILKLRYYQENKKEIIHSSGLIPITLTAIFGVSFWFLNGPDPRFSWSFLLLSTVPIASFWLALLNVIKIFDFITKLFAQKTTYYILVFLMIVILFQHSSQFFDLTAWQKAPDVKFSQQKLSNTGQTIYTPLETDQCWAIGPLCTPYYYFTDFHFKDKLSIDTIWGHTRFRREL